MNLIGKWRLKEEKIDLLDLTLSKAIDKVDVVILTTPPGFRPLHFKYAIDNDACF